MSDILDGNRDDNFRDRLKNYKEEPDELLWQKIAKGMNPIDKPLRERLKSFKESPDDAAWVNIKESLFLNKVVRRLEWATYVTSILLLSIFVYNNSGREFNEIASDDNDVRTLDPTSKGRTSFLYTPNDSLAQAQEIENRSYVFPLRNHKGIKEGNDALVETATSRIANQTSPQKSSEPKLFSQNQNSNDDQKLERNIDEDKPVSTEDGREEKLDNESRITNFTPISSTKALPVIETDNIENQQKNTINVAVGEDEKTAEKAFLGKKVPDSIPWVHRTIKPLNRPRDEQKNRHKPEAHKGKEDSVSVMNKRLATIKSKDLNSDTNQRGTNYSKAKTSDNAKKNEPNFSDKQAIAGAGRESSSQRLGQEDINHHKEKKSKVEKQEQLKSQIINTRDSISNVHRLDSLQYPVLSLKEAKEDSVLLEDNSLSDDIGNAMSQPFKNSEEELVKTGTGLYLLFMPTLGYTNIQPKKDDDILIESIERLSAFSTKRLGIRLEIGYEKALNKRLSVNGGLLYFQRKQTLTYYYKDINEIEIIGIDSLSFDVHVPRQTGTFDYELKNLGILLGVNYTLNGRKLMHKMGFSAELHKELVSPKITMHNGNQLSLFGNLYYRISYPVGKNIDLMLQPTFNYALRLDKQVNAPFYVKPYGLGINFGLYFHINK